MRDSKGERTENGREGMIEREQRLRQIEKVKVREKKEEKRKVLEEKNGKGNAHVAHLALDNHFISCIRQI